MSFKWHAPRSVGTGGPSYMSDGLEEDFLPKDIIGVEREIKIVVNRGNESRFNLGYRDISYDEGDTRVLVEEVYPGEDHEGLILEELIKTEQGPMWYEKWDAYEYKAHRLLENTVTAQMEKDLQKAFKKEWLHGI